MSEGLLYEIHGGIGRITFNRPQARNSFTFQMYEELGTICREAGNDSSLKVLVLTGAGEKAFCAGADLKERQGMTENDVRLQVDLDAPSCAFYECMFQAIRHQFLDDQPARHSRIDVKRDVLHLQRCI